MCQTFSVCNPTFNGNMLSRKKTLQSVLMTIISLPGIFSASQYGSCIRYETFQVTEYKMAPMNARNGWFSHSVHFSPRRVTRVGIRSRRIFGCCDPGYQYKSFPNFGCQPICSKPCPVNSHCSEPDICTCNDEYRWDGLNCVSKYKTTVEYIPTTTVENRSVKPPCNDSCAANEECSASDNVCVCRNGFQLIFDFAKRACVRKCEPACPENAQCLESGQCSCNLGYHNVSGSGCVSSQTTTEEYFQTTTTETKSTEPPCNDSCTTNEECSASDNVCVCKDGFQRSVGKTGAVCVPKCEPECQHGDCTAPNTCDCWPHYERTNDTACRIQCTELSCVYGECDEQGTCVCAKGFLSNGTACVWTGDAILSEPDDCDCWSKFVWQKNETVNSGQRCLPLCDGDDSIEVVSECINFKHCQCYEGFLVCPAQIYKCSAVQEKNSTPSTGQRQDKQITNDNENSSTQLTLIIVTVLGTIFIVGVILGIWKKRQGSLANLFNYGRMTSRQDDEQT